MGRIRVDKKGFSLLEIILAVAIFAGMGIGLFAALSSQGVLDKARDGRRVNDIKEIQKAAELYYMDTGCYPEELDFEAILTASDAGWASGGSIYMKEVPLDPNNYPYIYKTTDSSCPQWMGIFTKLENEQERVDTCPIATVQDNDCTPFYFDNTWACVTSGTVDCNYLAAQALEIPGEVEQPNPTATRTPTPTLLPTVIITPTPTPILAPSCTPNNWACTGTPLRCNVMTEGTGNHCDASCGGAC